MLLKIQQGGPKPSQLVSSLLRIRIARRKIARWSVFRIGFARLCGDGPSIEIANKFVSGIFVFRSVIRFSHNLKKSFLVILNHIVNKPDRHG